MTITPEQYNNAITRLNGLGHQPKIDTATIVAYDAEQYVALSDLFVEAKAQATEAKAQATEAKAQATEAKAQATEAKAQATEAKAQATEALNKSNWGLYVLEKILKMKITAVNIVKQATGSNSAWDTQLHELGMLEYSGANPKHLTLVGDVTDHVYLKGKSQTLTLKNNTEEGVVNFFDFMEWSALESQSA